MAKFYEIYKSLILAMAFSGIYFTSVEKICGRKFCTIFLKFLWILPGVCMPIHFGGTLKYVLFDTHDKRSEIFGVSVSIFSFFFLFTFYSFYCSKRQYERLFELWDSMFQEELFPEQRQKLLTRNINRTLKWLKGFGSIITISVLVYCTVMYFNPSKKLTHPSGIPYKNQSPDYELLNTLDLITAIFGCNGLITFDAMTMAFISMEEAQLQHLKISLACIVDTVSVTDLGNIQIKSGEISDAHPDVYQMARAFEEIRKQVQIWITHHQQVLRFHDEFQKVYAIPLSAKFLYFAVVLCLACFLMLAGELTPLDVAFVIQYFFNNCTMFYVNVMHADTVAELANTIFGDAFEKSWHLYPKELKTLFHIIQMQSNRPVHYLGFKKYSLSSASFLKMLSSAYSLFTFLIQINRKKN